MTARSTTRAVGRQNREIKQRTEKYIVRWQESAVGWQGEIPISERAYYSRAAAEYFITQLRKYQPCHIAPILIVL